MTMGIDLEASWRGNGAWMDSLTMKTVNCHVRSREHEFGKREE